MTINLYCQPTCDFCDKEAVHFCSHGIAQACEDHVAEADKIESDYFDQVEMRS